MFRFKRTIVSISITVFLVLFSLNGISFATIGMSESEPNDLISSATVIPSNFDLNQEISGSIQSAGDVDYYKFTPINNAGYQIVSLGTTDTFGYLYDSNYNLLDTSDNQFYPDDYKNFELRYELTANNTYYIMVTHADTNGTGDYTLKISPINYKDKEIEPNDSFALATTSYWTDFFNPATAQIGIAGDEDYYKFTTTYGGTFTFETVGSTDTYGFLYNSSQNQLTSDDDSGEGANMKMVYTLSGQTVYYVKIRHWSSTGTGSYSLKITPPSTTPLSTDTEGDDFSSATQLTTENYVTYTGLGINYANDVDFFQFTPHEDGVYTFQSFGYADVDGEVFDSNQTSMKSDSNSGPYHNNFMIDVPLKANQTYYLKVTAPNGAIASYGIDIAMGKCLKVPQFLQLPYDNLCWATTAAMAVSYFNNDTINRTVDIAEDIAISRSSSFSQLYGPNYYTYPSVFNMPALLLDSGVGVKLYRPDLDIITYENPSFATTEYSPSLNTIIKSINHGYPVMVKVPNAAGGNHMLIIKGYKQCYNGMNIIYNDPLDGQEHMSVNYGTRAYTTFYPRYNDLEPNNTQEDSDHIHFDYPIQGSIEKAGDVDFYKFMAGPNITYILETTGTTDTYGELYDYNGNLIQSADNGGEGTNFKIECHLDPSPPTLPYKYYYIKVRHSSNGTGNYTLNISVTR